jgi:subtilase family serine protease
VVAVALALIAAVVLTLSVTAQGGGTRSDRYLGRVSPGTKVAFGLSLRMRTAAMEAYGAGVGSGRLPALSAAQIGERFGIPGAALANVRRVLSADGIQVTQAFKQRTQLLLTAPAARVERLLHVSLGEFAQPNGTRYRRPLGRPVIPAALSPYVLAATHLDTKPLPMQADIPQGGMVASDLAALYNLKPLISGRGLDGSGQTVAVYSQDTFQPSDIQAFDALHHIVGAPMPLRVTVEGGKALPFKASAEAAEVDLDLEVIREIAPRAQIINYETPCCNPAFMSDAIDRIVQDGYAKLANFSYGICEFDAAPSAQDLIAEDNSFLSAQVHGVTAFVSSGDSGAYSCQRYSLRDHRLTVEWPASSPHVVSVGGTYVDVRRDGTRYDELGWEDILSGGGGGGGVSAAFVRPAWQTGVPGIQNQFSTNPPARQVPDVAADAAFGSGYSIYSQGQHYQVGGTSAAAPFWTGSFVLIDQLAQRQLGHPLGFVAPLLYRAADRDRSAFYDVTLGGNRYYRAGPGWDYSTGLGTPNMERLAADVIAISRQRGAGT